MTTLAAGPRSDAPAATPPAAGETVHVVTWRLFDYDGGELTYGGLQRWLLALLGALRADGHPVVVHQRANRAFSRLLEPGVEVRGHRSIIGAHGTPLFNLAVHRAIPGDAPVIYMVEDVSYPLCRRRSVLVQHGVWWDGELSGWKRRFTEHMVRHVVRRAAGVVCVDTNFINWYRARWPDSGHDGKLHFLPNFVDPESFGPQPRQPAAAEDGRLTICFPRRSEPRRGLLLMAEVAPDLIRRYPEVDFRFVVGSGYHTDRFREHMLAAAVDPRRWSIEVLPFQRMREAYEHSAIVVIPTICGEGTSLAALEAMYFGCAVVATWVGGLPNLIQDGRNGLLVPPRAADLGAALSHMIEDGDRRIALGKRAMHDVLPTYGIDRWRRQLRGVLQDSLQLRQEVAR